jgi:hypothetical protein
MRLYCLLIVCATMSGLASCDGYAGTLLPQAELGMQYSSVRIKLLKAGDAPVSQVKVRDCVGFEDQCSMYPEVVACGPGAVGQAFFCRFEWKSKAGQRFNIGTTGEAADNMIVAGYALTSLGEIKAGGVD